MGQMRIWKRLQYRLRHADMWPHAGRRVFLRRAALTFALCLVQGAMWSGFLTQGAAAQHRTAQHQTVSPDSTRLERALLRLAQEERASERRLADFQGVFSDPVHLLDDRGGRRQLRLLPSGRPTWRISHSDPGPSRGASASLRSAPTPLRNAAALATIGAHLVLPGGALGINVDGSGEHVGLWDASGVRLSHREWAGRAEQRDAPFERRNHASHVAGTLVAAGRRPEARGAAPGARLVAHDWNNDATEMAAWALDGGLVSNHSYGTAGGWVQSGRTDGRWAWLGDASVSAFEDARFGRYDAQAASWDEVAAAAPDYLIVKSAGNERADRGPAPGEPYDMFTTEWVRAVAPRPADGGEEGFDTILDASLAKNVLTVGSVGDVGWDGFSAADVRLSSFSSMGPADDGRIKPDVVASGEYVESSFTFSDDAYGTSTGTSHAAPAVAGATLLLQELQRRLRGAPLAAATMKALLIHTALDVGDSEGPDYGFGWGLVRVPEAAAHVAAGQILEEVLSSGETFTHAVELADGEPLHVTVAWTDPPGAPSERLLNSRVPVLVNNLDLWVETPGGDIIRPWTLSPDNPAAPARRAPNSVDNVEQVSMDAPGSGRFLVHVAHTGSLSGGVQAFSLLVGRAPLPTAGSGARHQLAGRIEMGSAGLPGIGIRLSGPIKAATTSGRDGAYRLEALPAGRYAVRVSFPAGERAAVDADSVDIPRHEPLDVSVPPLLRIASYELLRTPHLLEAGESAAERRQSAEAGGVYGAELFFEADQALTATSALVALDADMDPLAAPWIGERASEWVADLSAWRASPVQGGSGTRWRARLPLIWISGEARQGDTVSFGVALRDATSGALLSVDTLRIPVQEPDTQAPLPRFRARLPGLAFSALGQDAPVEATFWDGSPLVRTEAVMVRAADTTAFISRITLADNGDLPAFQDFVPGDGVYSGEFAPRVEDDFRLVLIGEDARGNRTRRMTRVVYSSRPYRHAFSVGLWTSSYFESSTALLWSSLGQAGLDVATWDTFVRGAPAPGAFAGHDLLAWAPSSTDIARSDVQAEVSALLGGGTRLVVMLPENVPAAAAAWLQSAFGVALDATASGSAFTGEDRTRPLSAVLRAEGDEEAFFAGWLPRSLARERMAALRPVSNDARVLLMGSRPIAVLSGGALVTTLRAEHVGGSAQRAGLLARLVLAAAGGDVPIRIPALAPDTLLVGARAAASPDSVFIRWPARPVARYEIALENAAAEEIATFATADTVLAMAISIADLAASARIRSLTPTDTSAWAAFSLNPTATPIEPASPPGAVTLYVSSIYPQPAAQAATLVVESPVSGWLDVRLYSILGQEVGRAERRTLHAGQNRIGLPVGHLAPGVYVVVLTAPGGHSARASLIRSRF